MDHTIDYFRCVAFIFFLSFKPSEPHLSAYLKEVKHLTKHQRDAEVYTIYTYGSLLVVSLLALSKVVSLKGSRHPAFMSDKAIILLGCSGRMATRLLLLFGEGLLAMQLMQIVYSVGIIGEIAFYAYCLKVVPGQSQRLTAFTQASYLISHTCAGILGDWLLDHTTIGLVGLMWISAASVFTALLIACTLRSVEPDLVARALQPADHLGAIYSSRCFWLSSLWWVLSYPLYQTIYGYESSIYYDNIKGHDHNGTIFAIGLLAGAACSLLPSLKGVEVAMSRVTLLVLLLSSCVLVATTSIMAWGTSSELAFAVSFMVFFMSWSFANTLFYGETRRAVDAGMVLAQVPHMERDAMATHVVSTVFILNSAVGNLMNGVLAVILFTWLELDVETVFKDLGVVQATVTMVVALLWAIVFTRARLSSDTEMRQLAADQLIES